ncbi:MAG: hypothetical protein J5803_05700 [Desulfovibrio sp.]|nr:hypothetical protein [Desulfovibrio sp.]
MRFSLSPVRTFASLFSHCAPSLLFFCISLLLTHCAGISMREKACLEASSFGFSESILTLTPFPLFSLIRKGNGDCLRVYIEGDGHAFLSPALPSSDPTPYYPVALWLAIHDPSPNPVVYLARPGQYLDGVQNVSKAFWTDARYSEEVLTAYDEALDNLKENLGASKLTLVGFSGGGCVCTLLAERRCDVVFLGSIGGNINLHAWFEWKNLDPMPDSLDPMESVETIRHIPQRHVIGTEDTQIPWEGLLAFCTACGQKASCQRIPNMGHIGPWHNVWSYEYPSR